MNRLPNHPVSHRRSGFTIVELLVVAGVIAVLIALLSSALGTATESARRSASQRATEAVAASIRQFRAEFGFLPPLVHDGELVSAGNSDYQPEMSDGSRIDGPVDRSTVNGIEIGRLVTWSNPNPHNADFLRRRQGSGNDEVELSGGGAWDVDSAWDDRRYSRYTLAYYLVGVLGRNVDGVSGEGFVRPQANGSFQGIGYTVGSSRDRYESFLDTDRGAIRVRTGYARPYDAIEHGAVAAPFDELTADDVYGLSDPNELDDLAALVDNFGTAYRYYRWEHGRYNDEGRLVVESTLDLNIPPVLLDPELLVELMNDDTADPQIDLTGGNLELRRARFAVVGAGPDRLFGTEPVEVLVEELGAQDPGADPVLVALLRKQAMDDNVVAVGE